MMFRFLTASLLTLSAAFSGATACAQVMGLTMGESMASLKAKGVRLKSSGQRFTYQASNLPKPSPMVPEVTLLIHPRMGLCTILASSVTHDDNSFGEQTRSQYEKIRKALISKYSSPTKTFDFVRSGSVWDEDKYFMIGLEKDERLLVSYWVKSEGANLPKGIQSMEVKARALTMSRGYVNVKYESVMHNQCVDALQASDAEGL